MNTKLSMFILVMTFFISCNKDTHVFTSETITEVFNGNCKAETCPEVSVDYIILKGNKPISKKINSSIHSFIINSLELEDSINPQSETIVEAANNFLLNYEKDKAEFPDLISEYFAEISVCQTYSTNSLLSFELQQYIFTGGAHGYGSITFLNCNTTNGEQLSTKEIFKNEKEFRDFVEILFRKEYSISSNESINSSGFWFENDTFHLPETIGFYEEEVIILYNQYEIASYVSGPIELTIPLEDVLPYMAID
ncbi:MAG: hypothetical protein ACI9SJ_001875 [Flavobacteriaceae bacterium]|jgi:hypothetical protein|uniref:DUF3298 and DUF4163 domain-containing protein n=1 Tax=Candidatus Marifrigoribacter sp. Uisw_064 TaxID=3230970 RepID=UPI003AE9C9C4